MGSIIGDIIKEIPLSAVLKEKLLGVEAKLAEAETKVDLLQIDLDKANVKIQQIQAENQRLKDEITRLTQSADTLHPTAEKILKVLADHNDRSLNKSYLLQQTGVDFVESSYYLDELRLESYVEYAAFSRGEGPNYRLAQKGRKYVMDHLSK